jgi:hypothetical protein
VVSFSWEYWLYRRSLTWLNVIFPPGCIWSKFVNKPLANYRLKYFFLVVISGIESRSTFKLCNFILLRIYGRSQWWRKCQLYNYMQTRHGYKAQLGTVQNSVTKEYGKGRSKKEHREKYVFSSICFYYNSL